MKKSLMFLLVTIVAVAIVVTMTLAGCKKEAVSETTTAAETTAAATTAAETTVAETTAAEDMNAIDPFILAVREPWEKLKGITDLSWKGPLGETPLLDSDLFLTKAEVEKIKAGKPDGTPYTYAIAANNTAGEYSLAMNAGPNSGLWEYMEYLGVKQVAFASAEFDPVKQKADVESMLALKPDVIVAYATDPVTGAANFKPAVDAGIPLAFISTVPDGYTYGKEFIGISTNNPYEEGIYLAKETFDLYGDDAKVGYVFYDDVYFVCNYLDKGYIEYADKNYPNWTVYKQGFVAETGAGDSAAALILQHPDIEVFYTTYMVPAMHIVAALTEAGRDKDVGVVTFAIDAPTLINMIEGGPIKAICTDSPYLVGMNHAIQAACALIGKELKQPNFIVCPTTMLRKENVREIWKSAMGSVPIPDSVLQALDKAGL